MSGGGGRRRFALAMTLGTVQTGAVLLMSLASVKLTSIYLGPAGLALVAQMQGLLQICSGILGLTLGTAMVRLGSQYGLGERFAILASTALRIALVCGALILTFTTIFSGSLWDLLLGSQVAVFAPAIIAVGFGALATTVQSIASGAMNSAHETLLVSGSRVSAAFVGLVAFVGPMALWGLNGALMGVGVAAVLQCAVILSIVQRRSVVKSYLKVSVWSNSEFKAIGAFLPMMIVLSVAEPTAMILMRKHLLTNVSADAAGILQASYRLAEVTMAVLTSGMSLYFMPRLGALSRDHAALSREVRGTMISAVLLALGLGAAVYVLRDFVVAVIFNHKFADVADLVLLQMIWFVLRIGVWVCGMVLVSQMRQAYYMATQLIGPAIFVSIVLLLDFPGAIDRVVVASCVSTAIQLALCIYATRDLLFYPRARER